MSHHLGQQSPEPVEAIDWKGTARTLRNVVTVLGPKEFKHCMEGEPDREDLQCTGTDEQHAAIFVGEIIALLEHLALHMPSGYDSGSQLGASYINAAGQYTGGCPDHAKQGIVSGALLKALAEAVTDHHHDKEATS